MNKHITYIKGDATSPIGEGYKIVPHICNDKGYWGKGFVLAISKKWKEPKIRFKELSKENKHSLLGSCQLIEVEEDIAVFNMIAQHDIYPDENNIPPIRYHALEKCLITLARCVSDIESEKKMPVSIHAPKFGAGLAGGEWTIIESLIETHLIKEHRIPITIYLSS